MKRMRTREEALEYIQRQQRELRVPHFICEVNGVLYAGSQAPNVPHEVIYPDQVSA